MLTTKQKVLRRYWYATVRTDSLRSGPMPFTLMGEDLVLFLDAEGKPAALEDRCCHRTARLSKGWCDNGELVCGYHGWTYGGDGKVVRIPQFPIDAQLPEYRAKSYRAKERYGYVWVALDEPLTPIPDVPEDGAAGWRRIYQFYDKWDCAPLRLMENSFDNAHFSFVHKGTFGNLNAPKPEKYEIAETEYGFYATTVVRILNPPLAYQVTGTTEPETVRTMHNHWYLPFCRRLDIEYPSGIRHIIINCATPISDGQIQLVQLLYRNDTEVDCPERKLIEWDAAVIAEDRGVLESTDPDAMLVATMPRERHMPSDRPGMIMRKRLLDLLAEQGEAEVVRA
jgi:phenylpropionate dioxygenase-like ring-hydroxylating dioxygenase large terminal subunit